MSKTQTEFTVSRLIAAPPPTVWMAWTTPEHLEKWWCPAPLTCKIQTLDVRPGGAFDLLMVTPTGDEMMQTGAFLDVIAPERIVFTTALTKDWRPAAPYVPITAVITMRDENTYTRYETQVLYRDEDDRHKLEQMGFEAGWSQAIDQLEALITDSV